MYAADFVSWKEKILRELQADGVPVFHVHRFLDGRGSSPVDSSKLLLIFDTPHPPSHVYLDYTKLNVHHFIPRLRCCFRCKIFWPFESDMLPLSDVFPLW